MVIKVQYTFISFLFSTSFPNILLLIKETMLNNISQLEQEVADVKSRRISYNQLFATFEYVKYRLIRILSNVNFQNGYNRSKGQTLFLYNSAICSFTLRMRDSGFMKRNLIKEL